MSHARNLVSRTTAAAAVVALVGAAVVVSPVVANADSALSESYPIPASRTLVIDGHGWGHGEGMSQEGAKRGAQLGVPATGILAFYFPAATFGAANSPNIRVALTGVADGPSAKGYQPPSANRYQCSDKTVVATYCTLSVVQRTGIVVTDSATGKHPDTTTGVDEWGVLTAKDGLHLRMHTKAGWTDATIGGKKPIVGPITFTGPSLIRVDWGGGTFRDYRTQVSAVRTSPGTATTPSRMIRLATMSLDNYIRGVVYQESPASWPLQELEAQAIAARSYADNLRLEKKSAYDICDSTWCQVFGGTQSVIHGVTTWLEPAAGKPATDPVAQTADTILLDGSTPLLAQFSSSNGGWTAGGDPAYGPVRADPWDATSGDTYHNWTTTLNVGGLESEYGFQRIDVLTVTARDGTTAPYGGRVRAVRLDGIDGKGKARSVTITNQSDLRLGMRSTFWKPRLTAPTITLPASWGRTHPVQVSGKASPGATVDVWFHRQNTSGYTKRRSVVAGADGTWKASFVVDVDYRVYGVSQGLAGKSALIKAVGTTLVAPAKVAKGAPIVLSGAAEPGAKVFVTLHRASAAGFSPAASARADRNGHWKTTVTASVNTRYLATAAGHQSPSTVVAVS